MHTEKKYVKAQRGAICEPRREASGEANPDALPPELGGNQLLLVKPPMIFCYGSPRKLTQYA